MAAPDKIKKALRAAFLEKYGCKPRKVILTTSGETPEAEATYFLVTAFRDRDVLSWHGPITRVGKVEVYVVSNP